jgi:hypothetical protein
MERDCSALVGCVVRSADGDRNEETCSKYAISVRIKQVPNWRQHSADFEVCRFLISRVKWGGDKFVEKIDGRKIKRGKNFRFGHRHRIEGSDLIVWLKTESTKPIEISLSATMK